MKTLFILSILLLPVSLLADSPHKILPGVQFGMPVGQARQALVAFQQHSPVGTSALRHHLITSNAAPSAKLSATDKLVPVFCIANLDGDRLSEVDVHSVPQPEAAYESIRTAWANLKDIADSKFKRVGGTGVFPPVADFASGDSDLVTDSWDAEGMHIDLLIRRSAALEEKAPYRAVLRITETTPSK